jgi:hypothetical protein
MHTYISTNTIDFNYCIKRLCNVYQNVWVGWVMGWVMSTYRIVKTAMLNSDNMYVYTACSMALKFLAAAEAQGIVLPQVDQRDVAAALQRSI